MFMFPFPEDVLPDIMKSSLSNISLKLRDLREKGLIECVNPKEGKGRIYALTKKGKQIAKKVREMERSTS